MALDLSDAGLKDRIDRLRSGYEGYAAQLRLRNKAYLRAFSPEFDVNLGEHDQWPEPLTAKAVGKARSSFNLARAVAELWTALEAYPFPGVKFNEVYIPAAIPALDPQENAHAVEIHKAMKLVAQRTATMREHALDEHIRRGRLARHYYGAILRKNVFGHSWLRCLPNESRRRFDFSAGFDPSTVYPVWSVSDSRALSAVLVVTRRSARTLSEQYPDQVKLGDDGQSVLGSGWYNPTSLSGNDLERTWVWVEDYWVLDRSFAQPAAEGDEPVTSRVVNAIRVNGQIVSKETHDRWTRLPYFPFENDNLRDRFGFSDVGTVLPINDTLNRMVSQSSDVIAGESRPKFKHRSEGGPKNIELSDDGIIHLDTDEDIEQIAVAINSFPVQAQGQILVELLARTTGLNDSVWGRIVASQNSGRALATAWRSVAARLVPRLQADEEALDGIVEFMLEQMELNDWASARDLYNGYRDFTIQFPNQEPRDFMEVATVAINKHGAGGIDLGGMMEEWGEDSPDEMIERVRAEYTDAVLHPEKSQSYLLLQQLQQQLAIQAQQAGLAAQTAQAQLDQMKASPPNGAPGGQGPNVAAATQARTQAAQQATPTTGPGQAPGPTTQAGQPGNAQTQASTLVQDGASARNRIIRKVNIGG